MNSIVEIVSYIGKAVHEDGLVQGAEVNERLKEYMTNNSPVDHITTEVVLEPGKFTRIFYKVDGKWLTASGHTVEEATYNLLEPIARKLAVFDQNILGHAPTGHILRYIAL